MEGFTVLIACGIVWLISVILLKAIKTPSPRPITNFPPIVSHTESNEMSQKKLCPRCVWFDRKDNTCDRGLIGAPNVFICRTYTKAKSAEGKILMKEKQEAIAMLENPDLSVGGTSTPEPLQAPTTRQEDIVFIYSEFPTEKESTVIWQQGFD